MLHRPFQKLLSYELDVQVGIYEAKYHRDELMTDRKTLSEELKNLKESLDDNGPPSKVRAAGFIMSLCVRKPTIWVSDQVQHKLGRTVTEDGYE